MWHPHIIDKADACMHGFKDGCNASCQGKKFQAETVEEDFSYDYEKSIFLNGSCRFCSPESTLYWSLKALPERNEPYYIRVDIYYYRVQIVKTETLFEKRYIIDYWREPINRSEQ